MKAVSITSSAYLIIKTRPFYRASFLFVICLFVFACSQDKPLEARYLSGPTMGTSYNITLVDVAASLDINALQSQIDARLAELNQQMSTYIPESDIMRFNSLAENVEQQVEDDFFAVLSLSQQVAEKSQGHFDITIGPLVELWGFGSKALRKVPEPQAISAALARVGWSYLQLNEQSNTIVKTRPLWLDVSAVAKGFAVDKLYELIEQAGVSHFLVEVGGEMRVKGFNRSQQAWRIGIETPSLLQKQAKQLVLLSDKAIATSGDYRNYFEEDGQRYSHTIDPTNGHPVKHNIASVTVVSDSAAEADAWATALNVMGQEKALALANKQKLAAYFILYNDAGSVEEQDYSIIFTDAFKAFMH